MSYSILKVNLEESKGDIINFWKRNFPAWPEKKFTWFYKNNPCGRAACWVIKDTKTDAVAGSTAIFPRKVFVKGECLSGGITGDFGVDRKYRILGPALQLQKAGISESNRNHFDFLYGYPNGKSEPVQRRAGFKVIGSTYRMVKILRSQDYLERYTTLPFVPKLLSKPVDLAMRLLSKESYYRRREDFRFEVLSNFDKRFDDLWQKASSHYSIIGERTSEFLNWRFTQCPYKTYSIFALTRKEINEIHGYIVYYVVRNNVYIADLLVVDMNNYIDALVSEFLLLQRKEKHCSVSFLYFGNQDFVNTLKKYMFDVRDSNRKIVAHIDANSPFSSYILDENNWYLTEADND